MGELQTIQAEPSDLLKIAVTNGASVETLERLMALQERHEANQARKAFVDAMAAFKADPPQVTKTKHVKYGNTEYYHAELADVCEAAIRGLSKHGLSHRWDVSQADGTITVTCVITHVLGHSESCAMAGEPDKSGAKNAIQAVGSTVTYLQRYTLMAITGLAAKGMDDDGQQGGWMQPWLEKINAAETVEDLTKIGRDIHAGFTARQKDQIRPEYQRREAELKNPVTLPDLEDGK